MTRHFYLISFLLVCFFTYHWLKQPPSVRRSLKIRHFIAAAFIAVITSEDTYTVFFAVFDPQKAVSTFYLAKGFAPAWLALSLRVVSTILGAIIWTAAFSLAARDQKARKLFLKVWPAYTILFLVQYVEEVQVHGVVTSNGRYFCFYILGSLILMFLSFVIYLQFQSRNSDELFLSKQTV